VYVPELNAGVFYRPNCSDTVGYLGLAEGN
jgi:hypothetical protein